MLKKSAVGAINWYQRKGGSRRLFAIECNFTPTCSEYTKQAIEKHGVFKGIAMGWRRICACNNPNATCKCIDPVE